MSDLQEITQPLSYRLDELRADVRPLRGQVEEVVLALRSALLAQGIAHPVLTAALDLCYEGEAVVLTVPFPIEIEDAAVCAADPLPLDRQALHEAVAAFHHAYAAQHGTVSSARVSSNQKVQVVQLRTRTQSAEAQQLK